MQKQKKNLGLKRFWNDGKSDLPVQKSECEGSGSAGPKICSVLVIWPSQGSLKEGDIQSSDLSAGRTRKLSVPDPGIDSNQESQPSIPQTPENVEIAHPENSSSSKGNRVLLHPDHARTMTYRSAQIAGRRSSLEEPSGTNVCINSYSSSVASSMNSVAAGTASWMSDPLQDRRSSTPRYSLLDALDLEYALMRASGRGSIGPCSLSQSLQKLSFTQSLAFPALARGLDNKRSKSEKSHRIDSLDSGVTAFAKVVTALLLVFVSVLVFGVVYKFVRT